MFQGKIAVITGGAQGIGQQEGSGVGPVMGDARAGELVVMVGREGAADHGAGGGQMDGQLVGNGRVLYIGDALGGQQ